MKNISRSSDLNIRWLIILLSVAFTLIIFSSVSAQDSTPRPPITDDQVNAIAKEMYCPVCENTPLDVCPTQACIEWRELIRDLLAEGKTEAEIKEYFVDRFGDRVLAAPPARGLNWLVYVIPPIAILAGVFILYSAIRAWRQPLPAASAPSGVESQAEAPLNDEYTKRIEEELRKL
jgi:cytochrome c-type biogenesis protein CcmH